MAGKASFDDDDLVAEINVTPLVDVILVLLIIFMVTATFMKEPVIPVKLPRAASAQDAPANSVALVLDLDGELFLNGQSTTRQQARETLKEIVTSDPATSVVLAADGRLAYEKVAEAIDLVKGVGAQEFSLHVSNAGTPQTE